MVSVTLLTAASVPLSSVELQTYDLIDDWRTAFLKLLKAIAIGANKIKVGCFGWSEHECVSAGRFLVLLSEAGWKIEGKKVFRMDAQIYNEGV